MFCILIIYKQLCNIRMTDGYRDGEIASCLLLKQYDLITYGLRIGNERHKDMWKPSFNPADTTHWHNVGLMLGQHCRQSTNIKPTSGQCVVFAENETIAWKCKRQASALILTRDGECCEILLLCINIAYNIIYWFVAIYIINNVNEHTLNSPSQHTLWLSQ